MFRLAVDRPNNAPAPVAGKAVDEDEVFAGFHHIHPRAQAIIRHGTNWKLWVPCDREPVETWVDGRVVPLGDAANPTLQYMAQRACMALEYAVCLADEIALCAGDIEAALDAYRRRRVLRTTRVQLQSRAMGKHVCHPHGVHAALRNAVMGAKSDAEWHEALAWLYDGDSAVRATPS